MSLVPPESTSDPAPPASFRDLIGRWPATRSFARDAGCSALLARQWRHRNFIPPQYWPGIVAGAARRGIPAIDAALLARLAAALRGGGVGAGASAARRGNNGARGAG